MIPAYQITSLVLDERRLRDAERLRRHDHGEPGIRPAAFARVATGFRFDSLRRVLARLATPAQRPTAA
jgi:hypothetical protein